MPDHTPPISGFPLPIKPEKYEEVTFSPAPSTVNEKETPYTSQLPAQNPPFGPDPTYYGDWTKKGRCIDF